ncbi:MAG: hypothetical protein EKK55_06975 [Rhodocyclaceae bacterium]|nr:MAG: hypothetical protein EKK55_06975 [Rhodocyclaceae bacterium]
MSEGGSTALSHVDASAFSVADLADVSDGELIAAGQRAREGRVALARTDSLEFNAFVLRDEDDGSAIENAPFHEEVHELLYTHNRVCLFAHVESGKSQSFSVGRVIWRLGLNPGRRIAIVSAAQGQAKKLVGLVAEQIEQNPRVREVFPHLRPGRHWSDAALTVERPGAFSKDPSLQACGLHGSVVGSRIDDLIFDDALNYPNTRTLEARRETERWISASFGGRVTRRSQILWLGTPWHPEDPMHVRARRAGWIARRFPVRDRRTGKLNWPARWPLDRILQAEIDFGGAFTAEARRQLYCEPVSDEERGFDEASIAEALRQGVRADLVFSLSLEERDAIGRSGGVVIIGVDPAGSKRKRPARLRAGAKTVFTTLLVYGNGRKQVLWTEGGKLSATEIRDKIIELHERYGAAVVVEDNAVQSWMVDIVGEVSAVPVYGLTTGFGNKHDPAFGVLAIDVGMKLGKWIIPSVWNVEAQILQPVGELADTVEDMRSFSTGSHTGDYLMSLWIAAEGARLLTTSAGGQVEASVVG